MDSLHQPRPIDGRAVGALIVFAVSVAGVVALVLWPLRVALPPWCCSLLLRQRRQRKQQQQPSAAHASSAGTGDALSPLSSPALLTGAVMHVPHWIAPPLGVALMACFGAVDARTVLAGVKGERQRD